MSGFLLGKQAQAFLRLYFDVNYHFDSVMSHDVPADVVCLPQPF